MTTQTSDIYFPDATQLQPQIQDEQHDHHAGGSSHAATIEVHQHDKRSRAASIRQFVWHLLPMVLSMVAGMMIYHLLVGTLLAGTGFAALTKQNRLFGYWMMVASMVLGMLALMRYHRSTWRYCLEMTLAMLAPLAAMTVLVFFALFPIQILYGLGDPLMILAMAAYMLYRPVEHAHGAHKHAGHQPSAAPQTE